MFRSSIFQATRSLRQLTTPATRNLSFTTARMGIPADTPEGLKIESQNAGSGPEVKKGDSVDVHYKGTLEDGTEFDQSYKRGQPLNFTVGAGMVIQGWDAGLVGMQVGEKRKLTIPSNLAYGERGIPGVIPENATLIFETELVKIR
ncbi:Peptidyl-prolyl cis-trans isomerase fpr2 [Podospora pseudopauciseta]|uniref:peptidylprolyl isomerase n=1 Tax=Podospora pseudopauciseta TaxID=2093780 RepID=A0ABR0HN43_9PEZI|nr:Peptidyl-prolyl cis-trans isomerase fpr2 [Podospora pseudopauciseta]